MAYRVHIRQFDGPLDLLLHLIGRAEIDIADIFVSEITQQYLSYMDQLDEVDMDTASDFLAMAATLLYIKSRHLLPRPPREEAEDAQEDPEQALIRQLREYKTFKEAGGELQALLQSARDSFTRLPEDVPLPPPRVELTGATQDGLYRALRELLARRAEEPRLNELHDVHPDRYTVRGCLAAIRSRLRGADGPVPFEALFSPGADKLEIIVTFMALLDMLARGEAHVRQGAPFAPITVRAGALRDDGDDDAYAFMDEVTE